MGTKSLGKVGNGSNEIGLATLKTPRGRYFAISNDEGEVVSMLSDEQVSALRRACDEHLSSAPKVKK